MLGRQIGSYRVLRKIGEGGMGTVYETVHTTLGRRAAVKILRRTTIADTTAAARFFNEAKAISMVSHPCLVTIFEHGTYRLDEGGGDEAYIVMEYIEGESLRARLDRTYLGGSAIGLVRQLASALAVTHKQRVIHRDLKPDNVMLVADDTVSGGVRAKILDFGLAKLLEQADAGDGDATGARSPDPTMPRSVKTRTGMLIGTPMYMSPEQCHGSAQPDDKTDVYSLGIMFFELLYGDPPFVSRSAGELYAMHLFFPVPDLRELVPGIDPKVAALVHRMLEKKPAARPSMEELLAALQGLPSSGLADGPFASRPCAGRDAGLDSSVSEVGPANVMRRHLARLADQTVSDTASAGDTQISTAGSQGEQVAAVPLPGRRVKLVAGGVVLAVAMVASVAAVRLQRPSPPTAASAVALPAATTAPPESAKPAPPPPAPPPVKPAKPATKSVSSAVSHSAKDKPPRKTGNGPKTTKAKYDVNLWK